MHVYEKYDNPNAREINDLANRPRATAGKSKRYF